MKLIPLSKKGKHAGKYSAMVDDEDYSYLNQWNWTVLIQKNTCYAYRNDYSDGRRKKKIVLMHRAILQAEEKYDVDHSDHNGLNNQRSNLRLCSTSQNCGNSRSQKPFGKGAYWYKPSQRWRAMIMMNKKTYHLGYFDTAEEAHMAYLDAAKKYFGEFVCGG